MTKPAQKLVRFDWAMKYILRDKANFDVLEGFLTCLLKEKIIIEDLLESESNPDGPDGKTNRVDLKCKDANGRQIIVEVQSQRKADYFERIVWGTSKAVVESIKRGDDYIEITKVISVSILYHDLDYPQQNRDYLYYGKTDITGCHYDEKLHIIHGITKKDVTSGDIFPEYHVICVNKFDDTIRDQVDEWVYIFK
ncbi:MAG: PD-(D/E)XK nuclease family transposase, partial [Thermoguttaceae bacterium]